MKTAVIFVENVRQIVLTPENNTEKYALSMFNARDDIELLIKEGRVGHNSLQPFTANVSECEGGFLRVYSDDESRILVLKPKEPRKVIYTMLRDWFNKSKDPGFGNYKVAKCPSCRGDVIYGQGCTGCNASIEFKE